MEMQLTEIANVVGAQNDVSAWQDIEVSSVAFDTRQLQPGALFVPLDGARDGHEFIKQAQAAGAVASFWQADHGDCPVDMPILVVDNPLKALQKLAQYYLLMKVNPKVVAVTGSNGKTTTKDMIAAVLATQFNVHKTQDNFNNEIGVPMTILGMKTNTEILVIEMGMDRPGQLDFLSNLVKPDVAVITMIGEAHIEFFGTRAKIADAKMEITHGLKEDGLLVYNGDEPLLNERVKDLNVDLKRFGNNHDNDLYPETINAMSDHTTFTLNKWPDLTFSIPMIGAYNVNNALAALLVGRRFHIKPEKMQAALADFQVTKNRTQWLVGSKGERILSDVYNSNPTALRAVLRSFGKVATTGRRIAVIGDMLELGDASQQLHSSIAAALDPQIINEVYLYGNEVHVLATALKDKYDAAHLHYYPLGQQAAMIAALQADITPADIIMLKGSHGMHLENVLVALQTD
ncbi:MAG: UDP-N-acetylmuramoyl-tripeptide--D-alanyl-D-alanine ligase [Candidatus Paralactobacillus gallistercoris]|uniref:UDP-N-acetylmuramoyl-tripeptide--D-alanyl-D-alanine ligase n=1 Tax=Candidatus Paralactobacillus gallistercoris TaxID=2838724 RepID=A0A948TIV2_9LACO|nr:UDP-N-acetylmuramoyl-tripeptide--D-alanyl-D-alanine ligase [Candidatus Paralactobacillus gallistercoris]